MDLTNIPIEELMRMRESARAQSAPQPEQPAAPALNLSEMPLDQLMALRDRARSQSQAYEMPAPPPGAVTHGGDGKTYVAGQPGLTVDRRGTQGTPQEEIILEAQKRRAQSGFDDTRWLMPVAQGLGLSATDELVSGLAAGPNAMRSGNTMAQEYAIAQQMQRQALERQRQERPIESVVGEIGGSVATGLGIAGAGGTALRFAGPNAGMGTRAGLLAADGAALGAVSGFAEGEGAQDRLRRAGMGAVIGGGAGAAGSVIGDGIGAMVRSPQERAALAATNAGQRAGMATADDATRAIQELGPDARYVDTLGPRGRALARNARDMSPEAREQLEQFSLERMAGGRERLMQTVQGAGGLSGRMSPEAVQEAIRAQRQPEIRKAYDAAKAAGYDLPDEPFRGLRESPLMQRAIKEAEDTTRDRVVSRGADEASQLAVYDAAKKRLDAMSKVAARAGDNDTATRASDLARLLRETVDNNLPEAVEGTYSSARALAQDAKKAQEAVELGAMLAKPNPGADALSQAASLDAKYSPFKRQGYAAQQMERIGGATTDDAALGNVIKSLDGQAALRAGLDDKAEDVAKAIARERDFMAFNRELTGGSNTARYLQEIGGLTAGGSFGAGMASYQGQDPLTGAALGAVASKGIRYAGGKLTQRGTQETADELARLLLSRVGPEIPKETRAAALAAILGRVSGATAASQGQ